MDTYSYILITFLAIAGASTLPPCPAGRCGNITVFLGVRYGSKVIRYPIYPEVNEEGATDVPDTITETTTKHSTRNIILGGDSADFQPHSSSSKPIHLWPQHRPIPTTSEIRIDYTKRDGAQFTHTTTETAPISESDLMKTLGSKYYGSIGEVIDLFQTGTLNLTLFDITGDDLKRFLEHLSERSSNSTKQLKRLLLGRNNIRYLPAAVFPLDLEYELQELTLNDNPLKFLQSQSCFELSRLRNLKILNLSRTGLYSLQYLYLTNLEVLDLSGNHLSSVPSTLEHLHNLQKLDLSGNRIITLEESPMSRLKNLKTLSLANNGLRSVIGEPFKSLYYLKEVYLNTNNLKEIAPLDKVHLPTIVHLRDNPFECSCPLLDSFRKQTPLIDDRDQLTCKDGDQYTHLLLSSMSGREAHKICPGRWDWFMDRAEQLEDVARWFRRRGIHRSTVVNLLWWLSLGVIAVAGTLVVRRHYRGRVVNTVPDKVMCDENCKMCKDVTSLNM